MADIRINATGDASGGKAALDGLGESVGKSAVKWQEMANAAKFAAKEIVSFLTDSVKKYAESEKVLKQLQRAAGDYSDAIDEQSKALGRLYAVDDDLINQSAILLTQWGGVGAATKSVETAALNLASAFGTDLNSATADLIRNVESGGVGLAKMGIHFKATGDKGKDLAAAVAAINEKLGGAAAADANSLEGQMRAVTLAGEDFQKMAGGVTGALLVQTGILGKLTEGWRALSEFISEDEANKAHKALLRSMDWVNAQTELVNAQNELKAAVADPNTSIKVLELFQDDVTRAQAKVDALLRSSGALLTNAPGVTGRTNKGIKDDAKVDVAAHQASSDAHDAIYKHEEESAEHKFSKLEKLQHDLAKSSEDGDIAEEKRAAERAEQDAKEMARIEEKALKDQQDRAAKQAAAARAAGDQIGAAMVNALADQLAKLAEGGEFDAALFIGDILAAAVGVAGGVIGTAFGAPAVGAALGNLAAMGIRAGSSAISKSNKKASSRSKYHDGGWVEPRYHDGAWIGADEQRAILQTGERVLSRNEVRNMGGPAGVDSAVRRGGGLTLNVSAIDAKSMADTFAGSGADGLKQALKRGQGALPALFAGAMGGKGPR